MIKPARLFFAFTLVVVTAAGFVSCPAPAGVNARVPGTPAGMAVPSRGTDFIRLRWDHLDATVEYFVYADTSAAGAFSRPVYRGALTECEDTGLAPETDYYYKIVAANYFGAGVATEPFRAATSGYAPAAPGVISAAGSDRVSVNLSWDAVARADSYRLLRDTSAAGAFTFAAYEGAALSFRDATVAADTIYHYKLMALNAYGSSQSVTPLSASVRPPAPGSATAGMIGRTSVTVSWPAPHAVYSSRLYRFSPPGENPVAVFEGMNTSFTDTNLSSGTLYEYRLCYLNCAGIESEPFSVQATTLALSVREVRDPASPDRPASGDMVTLDNVYVTGILRSGTNVTGFYVQDNSSARYSGIYVYTVTGTYAIDVGDRVSVRGTFGFFYDKEQISAPTVTLLEDGTTLPFAPLAVVDPASITTGGADAAAYQSMLVSVSSVTAETATALISTGVYGFTVTGGLLVCDRLGPLDPYAVGDTFTRITGILGMASTNYRLEPRGQTDIVE